MARFFGEWVIIALVLGLAFYDSYVVGLLFTLFAPFYMYYRTVGYVKRKKERLSLQFKDAINSVSVSLVAGYSVENAFNESLREMVETYGENSEISKFLNQILRQVAINKNIEEVLLNKATQTGIEDIISFSNIFYYAKRSGGNMVEIIADSVTTISKKIETSNDISVIIAAKQYEQYIMQTIPIFIIFYLRLTSNGLIDGMYTSLLGRLVMTACLLIYALAVYIASRIINIKV